MDLMVLVVTLLCHGCPTPAIVAAFSLDERTVEAWLHCTGTHAARVHAAVVETGQVDLGQVQADEICVKVCRGRIWPAMALAVPSRLWLGGDLSPARDGTLVTATLRRVAACAANGALLLCVDGFAAYVGAVRTGRPGHPRLVRTETVLLVLQRRLCKTAVFSGKSRPLARLCWPSAPIIAAIRVSTSSTKAPLHSYWKNPSL